MISALRARAADMRERARHLPLIITLAFDFAADAIAANFSPHASASALGQHIF